MTIGTSQNYLSSLLASPASATQAPAFSLSAATTATTATSGDGTSGPSGNYVQSAIAKLQQIDPQLADKLAQFRADAQKMADGGASTSDVYNTLKQEISDLSDKEKSELSSVAKPHHHGHHGKIKSADTTDTTSTQPTDALGAPIVDATQPAIDGGGNPTTPGLPFCPSPFSATA